MKEMKRKLSFDERKPIAVRPQDNMRASIEKRLEQMRETLSEVLSDSRLDFISKLSPAQQLSTVLSWFDKQSMTLVDIKQFTGWILIELGVHRGKLIADDNAKRERRRVTRGVTLTAAERKQRERDYALYENRAAIRAAQNDAYAAGKPPLTPKAALRLVGKSGALRAPRLSFTAAQEFLHGIEGFTDNEPHTVRRADFELLAEHWEIIELIPWLHVEQGPSRGTLLVVIDTELKRFCEDKCKEFKAKRAAKFKEYEAEKKGESK